MGVERPQDRPAAVQQGDQLPAGEIAQRRHGLEIGIRAIEEMLGEAGQGGPQPARPATRRAAGGRRESG